MTSTVTTPTDTLETVPVADLIVDANVRSDLKLDPSFVSSIRNHGILQPPVGWRDDAGKIHITAGQRRTLAAGEIGMDAIQVVVKPKEYAEATRIVAQLTENEQREQLTEPERVAAYQQLSLFGVSVEMIARRTNAPKKRVETALTVARSDVARDALAAAPITLDQAAVLVEFQDDVEQVDRLLQVAAERPGYFDHEAQQIRQHRTYQAGRAALAEKLTTSGWDVREKHPKGGYLEIDELWVAGDDTKTVLTVTQAKQYTDRIAMIHRNWHDDKPKARYFISRWAEQGLDTYEWRKRSDSPAGPSKEQKAQKRRANADMRAATTVRRTWLRTFLAKTHGSGTFSDGMFFIAAALAGVQGHLDANDSRVFGLACELLEIPFEPPAYSYDAGPQKNAFHAAMRDLPSFRSALTIAIARTEVVVGDPKAPDFATDTRSAPYLKQLREWGYALADVEQAIVDRATGATVADVITHEATDPVADAIAEGW